MTTVLDAKTWLPLRAMRRQVALGLAVAGLATTIACGGSSAPPPAPQAPPPMPVDMQTLAPKPIEKTTELVGVVKSRHSTTVQPQAEGFLTNIRVKSGDRVTAGQTLMEIDAKTSEAALRSIEAAKSARDVDVTYAQQELARAKKLLDVGAGSQQDYDRAANALKVAEAQARTTNEQVSQQRTDLGYYKVAAPTAGVLGDIPVRQGDRVTRTTVLTTIDDGTGLELYVNVPVQEAAGLQMGLPVRLLDESGAVLSTEKISFVAPSVDDSTQSVLVKTPIPPGAHLRTNQSVRAQVLWSTQPGLTVPITSVLRISGQFFVYVAESDRGGLVAHQRAVTVGAITGNDYIVLSGLKSGERLITGGIQKIGDGSPVTPAAPGSPAGDRQAGAGRGGGL